MGDIITNREKYVRGWTGGLPETECGYGSRVGVTKDQRKWLPEMAKKYGIKSVADIGAGDLNWIHLMDWDVDYTAYDLVPRHSSVIEFDLTSQIAPRVDCLLCLWVLNHMPYDASQAAIRNLKMSGSKYLIMTDRPVWHHEQPPEIQMTALESLTLTGKGDRMLLIEL